MNTTTEPTTKTSPMATRPPIDAQHHDGPSGSKGRTIGGLAQAVLPMIDAPAFYGPPIVFVLGPWLLFVLLLIGPIVLLLTLLAVLLVAGGLLLVLVVLIAAPYLLVRHWRVRRGAPRRAFAFVHRPSVAAPVVVEPGLATGTRRGWLSSH
jgi:hypothetical protein